MISIPDTALLAVAGVLAGIVGTAGGITSLISYPALLVVGLPALPANIANIVAATTCWPGSAVASRPELAGWGPWLRRWSWVMAAGGAAGAVLLLSTPSGDFDEVVPFLVAAGSLTLLAQPRLSAIAAKRRAADPATPAQSGAGPDAAAHRLTLRRQPLLLAGLVAVAVYTGYFGAGSGIMTLALMLLAVHRDILTGNALKNMVVGAATVTAALVLIIAGPVRWAAVVPLGVGLFVGSMLGPRLARRIPAPVLRWLVGLVGIGLAVKLWIAPT
jgi:uncharacterized membrane protein YfcA